MDNLAADADITFPDAKAPPPPGWACDARWFGEGWCDCGCGVQDVDCESLDLYDCAYNACEGDMRPDPHATTQCQLNFESCHPDYMWATDLPRRNPLKVRQPIDKP